MLTIKIQVSNNFFMSRLSTELFIPIFVSFTFFVYVTEPRTRVQSPYMAFSHHLRRCFDGASQIARDRSRTMLHADHGGALLIPCTINQNLPYINPLMSGIVQTPRRRDSPISRTVHRAIAIVTLPYFRFSSTSFFSSESASADGSATPTRLNLFASDGEGGS